MFKRSIAINWVPEKKKPFAKNAIFSCVQEARICLLVNMAINTLNTKLIWVDLICFYVKRKARRKEIQND